MKNILRGDYFMESKMSLRIIKMIITIMLVGILGFDIKVYAASVSVGQRLVNEAEGWKRYDDFDPNIKYSSSFVKYEKSSVLYNYSRHEEINKGGQIKFAFYGTSIALIDFIYGNRAKNCTINFDNGQIIENCSGYGSNTSSLTAFYVKEGLENTIHNVVIDIPDKDGCFCLDAIDINKEGYLLPYGQRTNKEILDINFNKEKVNIGESLEADISIGKVDNIIKEDITINYDSTKLKFLNVELMDGVKLIKRKSEEGSIKLVCRNDKSSVNLKKDLFKLRFKAIASGDTEVRVSKGTISDGVSSLRGLLGYECGQRTLVIE